MVPSKGWEFDESRKFGSTEDQYHTQIILAEKYSIERDLAEHTSATVSAKGIEQQIFSETPDPESVGSAG